MPSRLKEEESEKHVLSETLARPIPPLGNVEPGPKDWLVGPFLMNCTADDMTFLRSWPWHMLLLLLAAGILTHTHSNLTCALRVMWFGLQPIEKCHSRTCSRPND